MTETTPPNRLTEVLEEMIALARAEKANQERSGSSKSRGAGRA